MKLSVYLPFFLLLLFFAPGCTDLVRISFPEIQTLGWEPGATSETEVILSLEISGLEGNQLVDQAGHVLGLQDEDPTLEQNIRIIPLGSQGNGQHNNIVINLSPGLNYTYRAFALNRGNVFYGETMQFNTLDIPVFISSSVSGKTQLSPTNVRVDFQTSISGLRKDLPLNGYGLVWSNQQDPSLEAGDDFIINPALPAPADTFSFESELTGLPAGDYTARAFVNIGDRTFYGNNVPFRVGNTWTEKAPLENAPGRLNPLSFVIDGKAYVGGGADRDFIFLEDFWEYDPETDTWTQKANLGGGARYGGSGFTIDGQGFIAMGLEANYGSQLTTYRYEPTSNTWTKRADIPLWFDGTYNGISFVINGKAYVGAGENFVCPGCFLIYDPVINAWGQVSDMPEFLTGVDGFVIDGKGYVGGGLTQFNNPSNNFYEFNPANGPNGTWTQRADVPGPGRSDGFAFAIDGIGYLGGGNFLDMWAYHPANDQWTQISDLAGLPRYGGFSFALNGRGYVGMGLGAEFFQDIWEYLPE